MVVIFFLHLVTFQGYPRSKVKVAFGSHRSFLIASHSNYGSICYRLATIRRRMHPPMLINYSHVLVLV